MGVSLDDSFSLFKFAEGQKTQLTIIDIMVNIHNLLHFLHFQISGKTFFKKISSDKYVTLHKLLFLECFF